MTICKRYGVFISIYFFSAIFGMDTKLSNEFALNLVLKIDITGTKTC